MLHLELVIRGENSDRKQILRLVGAHPSSHMPTNHDDSHMDYESLETMTAPLIFQNWLWCYNCYCCSTVVKLTAGSWLGWNDRRSSSAYLGLGNWCRFPADCLNPEPCMCYWLFPLMLNGVSLKKMLPCNLKSAFCMTHFAWRFDIQSILPVIQWKTNKR